VLDTDGTMGSIDRDMAYKLLGFVAWQGGKWYVRRRLKGARRKVAIAGFAALLIAGAVAAQREAANR
jgi:hypothetical protein